MDKESFSLKYETGKLVSHLKNEQESEANLITLSFERRNQWMKNVERNPVLPESTITLTHSKYGNVAEYLREISCESLEGLLDLEYLKRGDRDLREHILYYLKELEK